MATATVDAKCSGGTGSATTGVNGTYTINLTTGTLPCVLRVTSGSTTLYSVATGTGTTATANITPITQMIVARFTGQDPATYFSNFSSNDAAALTSSTVAAAQAVVADVLKNNGIDISAAGDALAGNLVAANGSSTGNTLDQVLDQIGTKLTSSGTTLTQLVAAVTRPGNSTPSATPSVAADLLLQPGTASCPALRSGTYRSVVPRMGAAGSNGNASVGTGTVNATTQVVVGSNGTNAQLTAMAGSPCRFTTADGADLVVSQAGVVGLKTTDGFFGVLFPEQKIPLADLAGDWNWLGMDRQNTTDPLTPFAASFTLDGAGVFSNMIGCADAKTCAPHNSNQTLTVNSGGGYDVNFVGSSDKSRAFAYRAGGGELMMVGVGQDGTWTFLTKKRANTLPAVGTVFTGWNVGALNTQVNGGYQQSAFDTSDYQNTVTSVDTTANSYKRNTVINFTGPVTRTETVFVNSVAAMARNGYNYRIPETVVNSAGNSSLVREFINLPFRGMGFNALITGTAQFSLSVAKP